MTNLSPNSSDLWTSFEVRPPGFAPVDDGPPASGAQYFSLSVDSGRGYYRQAPEEDPKEDPEEEQLPPPTPKRIIICCDGTWQSSVNGRWGIPSNVTRLARSIARTGKMKKKKEIRIEKGIGNEFEMTEEVEDEFPCPQIVYYGSGIGAGTGVSLFENLRQAIFGDGLVGEVIKAYNFIVMNYCPGDQICCFGFSRGAFTARAVAGLITDIGVIRPKEMNDFPDLYELYRKYRITDGPTFRQTKAYREWITGQFEGGKQTRKRHRLPPESSRVIEVEGVFDTVGALGIPGLYWVQRFLNCIALYLPQLGIDYQGFYRTSLSNYTKHAFHALALDEHMAPFAPTLWHLPNAEETEREKHDLENYESLDKKEVNDYFEDLANGKIKKDVTEKELNEAWDKVVKVHMAKEPRDFTPELRQVWFPGGHVNIGGGNSADLAGFSYDFEQIALITFSWMCDQIAPFIRLDDGKVKGKPDNYSSLAHREIKARDYLIFSLEQKRNSGLPGFLRRLWRSVVSLTRPTPDNNREADIWGTGDTIDVFKIFESFYIFGIFVFFLKLLPRMYTDRTPGHYEDKFRKGSDTKEMIHPSIYYRMSERPDYKPGPLVPDPEPKKGELNRRQPKWKSKEVNIQGYVIKKEDRISRHMVNQSKARDFMAPLMEVGE
ncbi:hypothetical protein CGRA01v4_12898 [Colletotrichum graminicola]|uniref:T6SS Phospholipase effector Tle1-like catalytic domain-containing protein n=1 Tax=Colletotrichum graminicola (strain M1.001 / M2 / FGSC 10212) TaxID=645133 RepID=E3QIZ7_COLGM|nr:uncharacterized protein GLRG_05979 [Colletotrichum graminicola M1.001]EFQ30835.1 hypothetical protein GLRG_05979 [Colletotrichum graminicola M1.001]WDK21609.1 hypothetical protein CGRA01v4_12898 [Colletotrichum graminicola]